MIYQPEFDPSRRARRQATRRSHTDQRAEHHWRERPIHAPWQRRLVRFLHHGLHQLRVRASNIADAMRAGNFQFPRWAWPALGLLVLLPLLSGWKDVKTDVLEQSIQLPAATQTLLRPAQELTAARTGYVPGLNDDIWRVETVQKNQTVGEMFSKLGLSQADVHRVLSFSEQTAGLARVFPGKQIAFQIQDGKLRALEFDSSESERLLLRVNGAELSQEITARRLETRVNYASATIRHSLFGDGSKADMSQKLIFRMAELFNYDIDFAQDLQPGDSFALVYEQIFRDGEKLRDGEILAASFVNQGKRFEIFRHVTQDGQVDYLGSDGRSRKKAFIRTPVDFTRISSLFSPNRKHPILGRMRRHMGVDYAAPTGTPIRASGSGTVKTVGWMNGYGNTIVIAHKGGIETLYAHMSRFQKGLKRGDRVQQSETIGFVGSTGLSSGPHLHYEFRIGGTHRDPLSVDLPVADPLSAKELAAFKAKLSPLIAQLRMMEAAHVAKAPKAVPLRAVDG
jgi:murein DD-endopeptidase MepM/ murein hydrolase activator NlpD